MSGAGPAKANGHVRFHRIGRSHTGIGVNSGGNIHREDWNSTLFGFGIGAERGTGKAAGGGEAGDGVDKQIGILQTVHNGSAGRGKRLQCGFVGAIRREDGLHGITFLRQESASVEAIAAIAAWADEDSHTPPRAEHGCGRGCYAARGQAHELIVVVLLR